MMNDIEQYLYSMTPYLIGACVVSIFLNLLLWYELIASRIKCREQRHELLEIREEIKATTEKASSLKRLQCPFSFGSKRLQCPFFSGPIGFRNQSL